MSSQGKASHTATSRAPKKSDLPAADVQEFRAQLKAVLGEKDHIVPVEAASPVMDLVGTDDDRKTELRLKGGHIGLAVGRTAAKTTIPTIIEFLIKQSEAL